MSTRSGSWCVSLLCHFKGHRTYTAGCRMRGWFTPRWRSWLLWHMRSRVEDDCRESADGLPRCLPLAACSVRWRNRRPLSSDWSIGEAWNIPEIWCVLYTVVWSLIGYSHSSTVRLVADIPRRFGRDSARKRGSATMSCVILAPCGVLVDHFWGWERGDAFCGKLNPTVSVWCCMGPLAGCGCVSGWWCERESEKRRPPPP